jgi:hypothetical protein
VLNRVELGQLGRYGMAGRVAMTPRKVSVPA